MAKFAGRWWNLLTNLFFQDVSKLFADKCFYRTENTIFSCVSNSISLSLSLSLLHGGDKSVAATPRNISSIVWSTINDRRSLDWTKLNSKRKLSESSQQNGKPCASPYILVLTCYCSKLELICKFGSRKGLPLFVIRVPTFK